MCIRDSLLSTAKSRKLINKMFLKRKDEGVFKILISKHLRDEEERLKKYFRFTREQFASILQCIEDDLRVPSYNRVKSPITPAEKLALTLR